MEIERKYLLAEPPFPLENYTCLLIEQAYISADPVIRIRKTTCDGQDSYVLTCKGPGHLARDEWELPLKPRQYKNLLQKIETKLLKKKRYIVPLDNGSASCPPDDQPWPHGRAVGRDVPNDQPRALIAELDIYESPSELVGLSTVEVEFSSLEDSECFIAPDWFGREVTDDPAYSNSSLIRFGRPNMYTGH